MVYSLIEKKCACCGRIFVPAPYHVFKNCCSWTCYNKTTYGKPSEKHTYGRAVEQYDLNGNYIATFPTVKKAAEATGVSYATILEICKNKRSNPHQYIFKYT